MIDITDFIEHNITRPLNRYGIIVYWREGGPFMALTENVGKEAYRALGGSTGWVLY